jgi:hypothetical protein
MVLVSVQVVSSYATPWLSNTCLISVISFVITLYYEEESRPPLWYSGYSSWLQNGDVFFFL